MNKSEQRADQNVVADLLSRRALREIEHGVSCYEYQAMLEVDHADWPKYSEEMARRERDGIAYMADEAELASILVREWVRVAGVEQVRQMLTAASARHVILAQAAN